jgi:dynein heavy chain
LPTDIVSISNALIIEKTKRFCLLIDPQTQGITWLKNQWEEAGTLTVTNQQDSQFKKTIEMGVEMGRTIIVE